jgi:hypothetical protein
MFKRNAASRSCRACQKTCQISVRAVRIPRRLFKIAFNRSSGCQMPELSTGLFMREPECGRIGTAGPIRGLIVAAKGPDSQIKARAIRFRGSVRVPGSIFGFREQKTKRQTEQRKENQFSESMTDRFTNQRLINHCPRNKKRPG